MPSRASKHEKKRRPQDPVMLAKSVMEDIIGEKWDRPKAEPEPGGASRGGNKAPYGSRQEDGSAWATELSYWLMQKSESWLAPLSSMRSYICGGAAARGAGAGALARGLCAAASLRTGPGKDTLPPGGAGRRAPGLPCRCGPATARRRRRRRAARSWRRCAWPRCHEPPRRTSAPPLAAARREQPCGETERLR